MTEQREGSSRGTRAWIWILAGGLWGLVSSIPLLGEGLWARWLGFGIGSLTRWLLPSWYVALFVQGVMPHWNYPPALLAAIRAGSILAGVALGAAVALAVWWVSGRTASSWRGRPARGWALVGALWGLLSMATVLGWHSFSELFGRAAWLVGLLLPAYLVALPLRAVGIGSFGTSAWSIAVWTLASLALGSAIAVGVWRTVEGVRSRRHHPPAA